jgi:hypothetical protein
MCVCIYVKTFCEEQTHILVRGILQDVLTLHYNLIMSPRRDSTPGQTERQSQRDLDISCRVLLMLILLLDPCTVWMWAMLPTFRP